MECEFFVNDIDSWSEVWYYIWCGRRWNCEKDKLGDLSMELSVEVLQLTKELHARHENIISNQIGRSATSICANIAESKYAHGPRILLQSSKYRSKKPMKRANGLKCYGKADILTSRDTSGLTANVQQGFLFSPSALLKSVAKKENRQWTIQ